VLVFRDSRDAENLADSVDILVLHHKSSGSAENIKKISLTEVISSTDALEQKFSITRQLGRESLIEGMEVIDGEVVSKGRVLSGILMVEFAELDCLVKGLAADRDRNSRSVLTRSLSLSTKSLASVHISHFKFVLLTITGGNLELGRTSVIGRSRGGGGRGGSSSRRSCHF